jgi:PEGA domain
MHAAFGGVVLMSICRRAVLLTAVLFVAMFANATSRGDMMHLTVLDSETRSVSFDYNGVPNNCDQVTFDAYCRSSRTPQLMSVLLVQEGDKPPFRISCTVESKFSRCEPFLKGTTFDARREKHGVTLYYVNDKGKARKEFYTLVDPSGKPLEAASVVAAAPVAAVSVAAPVAPQPRVASTVSSGAARTSPPAAVAPAQNAGAPGPGWVQAVNPGRVSQEVRCSFTSTPAGAEITVDGLYVGNTPSAVGLITGTHVIVLSMPGFAEWKRELWVAPDSVLNVTANLQKTER